MDKDARAALLVPVTEEQAVLGLIVEATDLRGCLAFENYF